MLGALCFLPFVFLRQNPGSGSGSGGEDEQRRRRKKHAQEIFHLHEFNAARATFLLPRSLFIQGKENGRIYNLHF